MKRKIYMIQPTYRALDGQLLVFIMNLSTRRASRAVATEIRDL